MRTGHAARRSELPEGVIDGHGPRDGRLTPRADPACWDGKFSPCHAVPPWPWLAFPAESFTLSVKDNGRYEFRKRLLSLR